jgi:hypothetical protein
MPVLWREVDSVRLPRLARATLSWLGEMARQQADSVQLRRSVLAGFLRLKAA